MVRAFSDRPLPREVVERLVRDAQRGPSAGFTQGVDLLVLDGPEQTARFWDATFEPADREDFRWQRLFRAPLVVVPLASMDAYLDRYAEPDKGWTDRDPGRWPVPYWHIDAGFAAMLMLLTAVDEGLGALFFGIFAVDRFREAFGVPDTHTPIGGVAIGYPEPDEPSGSLARGRRSDAVHRGRW